MKIQFGTVVVTTVRICGAVIFTSLAFAISWFNAHFQSLMEELQKSNS